MRTLAVPVELLEEWAATAESHRLMSTAAQMRALLAAPGVEETSVTETSYIAQEFYKGIWDDVGHNEDPDPIARIVSHPMDGMPRRMVKRTTVRTDEIIETPAPEER